MAERTEPGISRWVVWLMAATAAVATFAAAVAWTGGFEARIGGIRLRSHSWVRPAVLAAAGAGLLAAVERRQLAEWFVRVWSAAESRRLPAAVAGAAMVWTAIAGLGFGTYASGGADSYGYVSQARLLAQGRLTEAITVPPAFTWPDVENTLTPLGYTRGVASGVIAPTHPPGLPLLMAPLTTISETAVYLLVPAFGVLAVWVTYRLGIEMGDRLAGALGAALLSVSPTFLYQLVQPMSDVPATACWLAALVMACRPSAFAAAAAGALSAIAILIRPNLAPLGMLIFIPVVFVGAGSRGRRAAAFAATLLPGVLALAWIQQVRYGSPLASGYGVLDDAFAVAYVRPNLARYPRWITETHTWFIWLSVLAPLWIARRAAQPVVAWTAVLLSLAIWGAYLPYVYFRPSEWFYTRFLLPAIAMMLFLASAVSLWALRRLPAPLRLPATALLLLGLQATFLQTARTRAAFQLRVYEQKYPRAGAFVRDRLPRNAFVLAGQHSGSIRYYADRPTLRWDLLAPGHLDDAVATLRAQGYEPFVVVDGGEEEEFRGKFEAAAQRAVRRLTPLAELVEARVLAFD